ncbi:hypothetical protein VP01_708g4 [Puccinia sorghi]|uniref:Uncharacterized protein n=1 Tax=Puccinia sorghi TaxID=27349 RepID=A0A0L6UFS3_9BASI|nr:hypothetical protein VP01_708g4 [Puccinia sorghi]
MLNRAAGKIHQGGGMNAFCMVFSNTSVSMSLISLNDSSNFKHGRMDSKIPTPSQNYASVQIQPQILTLMPGITQIYIYPG